MRPESGWRGGPSDRECRCENTELATREELTQVEGDL